MKRLRQIAILYSQNQRYFQIGVVAMLLLLAAIAGGADVQTGP